MNHERIARFVLMKSSSIKIVLLCLARGLWGLVMEADKILGVSLVV